MSKFNFPRTIPATGGGPIRAEATPSTSTYEDGPGYRRDTKSDLFLLAVSNMVGESTFYEAASDRDNRYRSLVHEVAVTDPEWTSRFLAWLRGEGNMRSASLVGALEAAAALNAAKKPGGRAIVRSVLQRADEPGEALAYWLSHYGRRIPKAVKRGISDAALRLYMEYPLLKYDTSSHGIRFADVLELTHPGDRKGSSQGARGHGPGQGDLFKHAIDRRHNRDNPTPRVLSMIQANEELRALAQDDPWKLLDTGRLRAAGMTWEDVLSLAGSRIPKAQLWEALIPTMGYMALLRNLRNFDEAGISHLAAAQVAVRLSDPGEVARSRQFPYRFLSAYEQAPSLRWGQALDEALNLSLRNISILPGRTLVLVDTSGSMTSGGLSVKSKMSPARAAAVFGVTLAAKGGSDLWGWASGQFRHDLPVACSVIREIDRFCGRSGEVGHGTDMVGAVRRAFHGHSRIVIISDMQTIGSSYYRGVTDIVPAHVPIYGFNLGGYQAAAIPAGSPNRIEFGGLTDATFRMIPLLESGRYGAWPWENAEGR
jgi:hypothetical protein